MNKKKIFKKLQTIFKKESLKPSSAALSLKVVFIVQKSAV